MVRISGRRGWAVAGLLVLGLASVVPRLVFPPPQRADVAGLQRWLALRDLSAQPLDVQIALVDRLQYDIGPEQLLHQDEGAAAPAGGKYAEQIARNGHLLKRVWFETRARQYALCEPPERVRFLRTQIDALLAWSDALAQLRSDKTEAKKTDALSGFFADIERWTREASAVDRALFQRAISDGVVCWLATTDLDDVSRSTREQLAAKLLENLTAQPADRPRPPAAHLALSEQQKDQLHDSILSLAQAWLVSQAQHFAKLNSDERNAFIDARVQQLTSLDLSQYVGVPSVASTVPARPTMAWLPMLRELNARSEKLSTTERQHLTTLLAHLQQRVMVQSLRKLWPFGQGDSNR